MNKKPTFQLITGILMIISLFFACQGNPSENKGNETPAVTEITETQAETETTTIAAVYKSATVYAAATDYYFEKEDGEMLEIRVSNIPEERLIKLPEGMLENAEEGPPDANPEMVGKTFKIIYNNTDEVIEIALAA